MLKTKIKTLVLFSTLALVLNLQTANAAQFEFTASTVMMETHPAIAYAILPYFKEMNKRSKGIVNVTYFNPGTLCASAELFNACEKGVVNFVMAPTGSGPALFPASIALALPLLFDSAKAASLTGNYMVENYPEFAKEYEKLKLMGFTASHPTQILSVRKPIRTLEDLKGLKISTASPQSAEMITSLGGVPVILALNDTYLALQRGMIDAAILPIPTFKSTKVTEVAKYLTICNLCPAPTPLLMTNSNWESLPEDVKTELSPLTGEAATILFSSVSDKAAEEDLEWIIKNHKVQVFELDQAEQDRWAALLEPVFQSWIERAERQGVKDPEALLVALKEAAKKYNDPKVQAEIQEKHKATLGTLYNAIEKK